MARDVMRSRGPVFEASLGPAPSGTAPRRAAQNPCRKHALVPLIRGNGDRVKGQRDPAVSIKARREYVLTREGARALAQIRRQLSDLYREFVLEKGGNA
jgi:hypothetical protein